MNSSTPSSAANTRRIGPWIFPLLASFLLAALFGLHRLSDSDAGFHLAEGRWIWENHSIPSIDTFTYTVAGRPYLDMEWLYQLGLYLLWRIGSYPLLTLVHVGLALLAFYLLWIRLRATKAGPALSVAIFSLAVLASESRFRVRPELLTWVLLGLTLWILERAENNAGSSKKIIPSPPEGEGGVRGKGVDANFLYLLPFVQLLWVNTEGLFFVGPVVMGIYLLSGLFHSRKLDPPLLKYSAISLALCMANPHFLNGFLFPFSFLSTLGSSDMYQATVQEFQSPWASHLNAHAQGRLYVAAYKFFCFFLFIVLLATSRKRKLHEWLLTLFFFALSASALRNIPLLLLACAPLSATCRDQWDWLKKWQSPFFARPFVASMLALLLLGLGARVVTSAYWVENRLTTRFGLDLDKESEPERACRFLSENHLDGRYISDLDSGDWLDWEGPSKSFIDGRLDVMGKDFFTTYNQSKTPGGINALIVQFHPDIFVFKPLVCPTWAADLIGMSDWRLVYMDSLCDVFVRKGYADKVPTLEDGKLLSENGVDPAILSQTTSLLSLQPPPAWSRWLEGFFRPSDYRNDLLNLGIFCANPIHAQTAECFFLEGIRQTQGKYFDFYYNLGLIYAYTGRIPQATLCMRRVLLDKPDDPTARQIVDIKP